MIQIGFTQEGINYLEHGRYHHPDPKARRRMEAVYFKSQGIAHKRIMELCCICSNATLSKWLKLYRDGGVELLCKFNYKGAPSELEAHRSALEEWFREHPPRTVTEAQNEIERLTGIRRSPTQIREFMKRIGMRIRKTGAPPGKAMDDNKLREQEDFEKDEPRPRLEETAAGERSPFFP
uniref:Transposase n=1 Tax=Candidatus Kentrum sp. FM TaxID=2126340 RepID=A0A450TYY6_9GAMM|nr:MAG: Transposase [Candidatus Kentron sp. FM]VFJ75251.1 MAG: Transposase [Candidatus Kentron sp. FM]VFK21617.1 MAG: Transposase [Candidatus Kentron sp. FM]